LSELLCGSFAEYSEVKERTFLLSSHEEAAFHIQTTWHMTCAVASILACDDSEVLIFIKGIPFPLCFFAHLCTPSRFFVLLRMHFCIFHVHYYTLCLLLHFFVLLRTFMCNFAHFAYHRASLCFFPCIFAHLCAFLHTLPAFAFLCASSHASSHSYVCFCTLCLPSHFFAQYS
jgi:hypothetical protein